MKTILNKWMIFSSLILLILSSCKKDETQSIANLKTASSLKASTNSLVLSKAEENNTVITFDFTDADFGYKAAISNVIQMAMEGTNFATPKEVILPAKTLKQSYKGIDFNAILLGMGLPTGVNSKIEVRLKSQISSATTPAYSNVLALTVNPYPLISYLYVPGAYQGWDPSSAQSLISATGNRVYEGVINYPSADKLGFKITQDRTWSLPQYGSAGSGKIALGGGDISAPGVGYYKLTADINALTLTFDPYSYGVIGDATPGGWGTDTNMEYDNTTQTWNLTVNLVVGKIKFRLNDDWGTNYGGSDGNLSKNGADIAIATAGNYKISFSLVNNTYTLTKL